MALAKRDGCAEPKGVLKMSRALQGKQNIGKSLFRSSNVYCRTEAKTYGFSISEHGSKTGGSKRNERNAASKTPAQVGKLGSRVSLLPTSSLPPSFMAPAERGLTVERGVAC